MSEQRNERFKGNAYTNPQSKESRTEESAPDEKKPRARETKPTFGERIANSFLSANREDIREHLIFDWLIPEFKGMLEDVLHMILFGTTGGSRRKRGNERGSAGYNSIYDGESRRSRERDDPTRQNFRRIRLTFPTREDARDAIDNLREALADAECGYVTVKELYSNEGFPTNSAMYRWGWYNLEEYRITRSGDEFVLEMPRAEVINR